VSINQSLQVLHVGGAGHKALLVLDGDADAYVFPQDGTKRWDTCAVDAILHAAGKLLLTSVTPAGTCTPHGDVMTGGRLTDAYGHDIVYTRDASHNNDKGVLCSMRDHAKYQLAAGDATVTFSSASAVSKV